MLIRKIANLSPKQLEQHLQDTKVLLDLIAEYHSTLSSNPICPPSNSPLLNKSLPKHPIPFPEVLQEIKNKILPNSIHSIHPMFYSNFPLTNSWPSIQGNLLTKGLGSLSFTKAISPASYEVEMIVSDWLSEMLDLPKHFYNKTGPGGGIAYSSASEAVLTAMACARLEKLGNNVVYTSDQAHYSVEKAARLLGIPIRIIPSYFNESIENYSIDIQKLKDQITKDEAAGFTPTMIISSLGGTNVCAIDDNEALGSIAQEKKMWFHIDAAYAGSFAILPEFRYLLKGVEYCTSLNINSSKMLLTGTDCSNMWVKDKNLFVRNLSQKPSYFIQDNDSDFKNWTIHLNRDCKALKAWFVIQAYGEDGIREHLRKFVEAGKAAEEIIKGDPRLELVVKRLLSLVVFRVKGDNEKTDNLVRNLLQDDKIFIFGSKLYDKSIIRFTPGSYTDRNENIHEAFRIILNYLD